MTIRSEDLPKACPYRRHTNGHAPTCIEVVTDLMEALRASLDLPPAHPDTREENA